MNNIFTKLVLFGTVVAILSSWTMAADKIDLRDAKALLDKVQKVCSMRVLPSDAVVLNVLGLGENDSLALLRKIGGMRGLSHSRYIQLYRNIPVWGEHVIITEDGSNVVRMHGTAITGIDQDITSVEPAFDAIAALEMMKNHHKSSLDTRETLVYENEISDLVIYTGRDKAVLSYAVSFFVDSENGGMPSRPQYIVDAKTKEVILHFEALTTEKGTGPGGNTKTGRYKFGAEYPAFEVAYANGQSTMNNTNVKTVNLNNGTSGSTAFTYAGTENTVKEINGAFSPLNDAHFFGGVVFGLYKDWYGTAPLTFQLMLKVHYSKSYENAFWNGSSMTFGDGATRFYPLVSLDVVCHEVSHGFTEQNSGLNYSAQSGGINEAFSDIAGEAAEYYMKKKNDWMVGADIFKSAGALRYLNNPTQDGKSIDSAKNYKSGMDVHYSSGVYNKAFYVLGTTKDWDTKKAFDVFVKANQTYWTPSSDFVKGAKGVLDAAKELGYPTNDVVVAFQKVDVVISTAD
jgi:Zn-dependent metalloprotease